MTDPDPIVNEVRRIREAHAARFNYDLKAIFRDIKEKEKRSGLKFVSYSDKESVVATVPETVALSTNTPHQNVQT